LRLESRAASRDARDLSLKIRAFPQEILITKVITAVTVDTINGIIPCDKRNCTVTEGQLTAPFSRANGALPHVYAHTWLHVCT